MIQAIDRLSPFWKWIIAVALCEATGIVSALLSQTYMNVWFDNLNKPSWNPPDYVFGPVWTFLYLLMGTALWLVWKSDAPEPEKKNAEWMFACQLFLNFWWSILFFRFHSPGLAFAEIILPTCKPCSASGTALPTITSSILFTSNCGIVANNPLITVTARSSGRVNLKPPFLLLVTAVLYPATI